MRLVAIYGLQDPRDGQIRYVGKSVRPRERLNAHIHHANRGDRKYHVYAWIRSLLINGVRPEQVILEWCTEETWQAAERKWIGQFGDLCNLSEGGEKTVGFTGGRHSEEFKAWQRARMSGNGNPMYGRPSPGRGKSPWIRGHHHTAESRAKMSLAQRTRPATSAKTRQLLSERKRGEHHHNARLTELDVWEIRRLYALRSPFITYTVLGEMFKISKRHAENIVKDRKWKHLRGGEDVTN